MIELTIADGRNLDGRKVSVVVSRVLAVKDNSVKEGSLVWLDTDQVLTVYENRQEVTRLLEEVLDRWHRQRSPGTY